MERKYQIVRIRAGDYILPANDATTLWRIYAYDEDGSLEVSDGRGGYRQIKGRRWACAKYERPFHNAGEWTDHDFLEWDQWMLWESNLPSRADAIAAALRAKG